MVCVFAYHILGVALCAGVTILGVAFCAGVTILGMVFCAGVTISGVALCAGIIASTSLSLLPATFILPEPIILRKHRVYLVC